MIREQGTIQEVIIRIVCIAAVAAALTACSQSGESPAATGNAALATQNPEMAEVVISTTRPERPRG
jgi:uncharacterized lipoprotein YajG